MKNVVSVLLALLLTGTLSAADQKRADELKPVSQEWPYTQECIQLILDDDLTNAGICASEKAYNFGGAGAIHLQATIALLKGQKENALKLVNQAIDLDGQQHLHHGLKARIHIHEMKEASGFARFTLAKKIYADYEKALELNPNILEYRAFLVNYKLKAPAIAGGDPDEALSMAEQGVDLGVAGASLLRARAYIKKKQPGNAIEDLNAAMADGFFDASAYVAGGYWALEASRFDLAKSYFGYLIEKDPENPNSYDCMGDLYLAQKDETKARESFAAALAKNPEFKPAKEKYEKLQNGT